MCTFYAKPQGCNVLSFSLRYCFVTMCCHCRSLNDVKNKGKEISIKIKIMFCVVALLLKFIIQLHYPRSISITISILSKVDFTSPVHNLVF